MNSRTVLIILVITLVALAAIIGGVWISQQNDTADSGSNSPTPTPTVSSSPTPTGSTGSTAEPTVVNEVSQVDIYLVALEDTNPEFQQIGCGDGLVPVERQISATRAPLGAAYRELLGLTTQDTEASGLYNALQSSDLEYDRAAVADGLATVYLTGQLQLGGECDNPRVKAQLEEIARQFPTVERVEVLINDRPLDEVLSLE